MPTRKTSGTRSAKSAPRSGRTAAGRRIAGAGREIAAYLRGKGKPLTTYDVTVPASVDIARTRARLGLSQSAFARSFGLDLDAVQAWEQGRRRPDRAARILLTIIAREPALVLRTLMAAE